MAVVIPPSLPASASKGEERLFHIFAKKLPDDFLVWYEPRVKDHYPDFIILSPTFGLLIIEAKGWHYHQIIEATSDSFKINRNSEGTDKIAEVQKSPLRQGKDYLDKLMNELKKYRILTQIQGKFQGKLCFPIGFGAVMSNITDHQAAKLNIKPLLPQPQVAYRNEMLAWETDSFSQEDLAHRLREMFTVNFP